MPPRIAAGERIPSAAHSTWGALCARRSRTGAFRHHSGGAAPTPQPGGASPPGPPKKQSRSGFGDSVWGWAWCGLDCRCFVVVFLLRRLGLGLVGFGGEGHVGARGLGGCAWLLKMGCGWWWVGCRSPVWPHCWAEVLWAVIDRLPMGLGRRSQAVGWWGGMGLSSWYQIHRRQIERVVIG
jgi:hypothetical protein